MIKNKTALDNWDYQACAFFKNGLYIGKGKMISSYGNARTYIPSCPLSLEFFKNDEIWNSVSFGFKFDFVTGEYIKSFKDEDPERGLNLTATSFSNISNLVFDWFQKEYDVKNSNPCMLKERG